MRKLLVVFLSALLLTGCAAPGRKMESALKGGDILQIDQESAPAGITMEFEWPEYDASVTGVTYLLKNNTDEAYSTGTYDELEVQSVNGECSMGGAKDMVPRWTCRIMTAWKQPFWISPGRRTAPYYSPAIRSTEN